MRKSKSIFIILLSIILLAIPVFAADPNAPVGRNVDVKHLPGIVNTVLDAAANEATATVVNTGIWGKQHYCLITTVAGTAPTDITVSFYVGADSAIQAKVATHVYTIANTLTQSFTAYYPGQYVKMSYDSRTGGASNTLVTAKCVSIE